jgi:hypothetical protein
MYTVQYIYAYYTVLYSINIINIVRIVLQYLISRIFFWQFVQYLLSTYYRVLVT